MAVGTLAGKDLRLLLRDPRAAVILLLMPLLFILVLGFSLGEGFFEKPDDRLRVSIVNLDEGLPDDPGPFPDRPWSQIIIEDLSTTSGVRVERIDSVATAEQLVRRGERPVVIVFGPEFSRRMHRCSFLSDAYLSEPGINPFYRDGVDGDAVDIDVKRDPTQAIGAAVIEQVVQVSLLRVSIPWMIGRAFEKIGQLLGPLGRNLLEKMLSKYDLTAKTWASLTRARTPVPTYTANWTADPGAGLAGVPWGPLWLSDRTEPRPSAALTDYREEGGTGILSRGGKRYQHLVPSYAVTFAFFLVLTTGWLFVAERRSGTMARLKLAPVTRGQVLFGKFLPCLSVALFQGGFLFVAGHLIFGMDLGERPVWLIPVIVTTAFAATGLAMLTASLARTETQVAVYGTLLVLVLAGVSGSLMPRELMPEQMRQMSLVTPHAWALDAYRQLLLNPEPELGLVMQACGVLVAFGAGFLALAWALIRLD